MYVCVYVCMYVYIYIYIYIYIYTRIIKTISKKGKKMWGYQNQKSTGKDWDGTLAAKLK